jgi:hypothetical protein
MSEHFKYDVFLSHSAKDKCIVRDLANRLEHDGIRVWFDEREIKAGDNIPARIEDGLENSRVLILCMSANAFGSDWSQLESYTFRFRDPLNKDRRFIPLRLDDAPIKGSLGQFRYIRWLASDRDEGYAELIEACGTFATSTGSAPVVSSSATRLSADGSDDYVRRRRDIIQQVFSAFEPIHAFFFKVCLDYLNLAELLRAEIPPTQEDRKRYHSYIEEIGRMLHQMHLLEGRLQIAGAGRAVAAMQQYRLQATEVNDMLRLHTPKSTKAQIKEITDELFQRKDRLYTEIAVALQDATQPVAKSASTRAPRVRVQNSWVHRWRTY